MEIMKAGSATDPAKLAGAITEVVKADGACKVQAIGAGAVNQAVKGAAIARGHLAPLGVDVCVIPGFYTVQMDGLERTGIALEVRRYGG